jgi:hypothetical protein
VHQTLGGIAPRPGLASLQSLDTAKRKSSTLGQGFLGEVQLKPVLPE